MHRALRIARTIFIAMFFARMMSTVGCANRTPISAADSAAAYRPTITQGIWGTVLFWEGDFRPVRHDATTASVDQRKSLISPVKRQIVVYPRAHVRPDAKLRGYWFRTIDAHPAGVAWSDDKGHFQISLPPGQYSLLVREPTEHLPRRDARLKALGDTLLYNEHIDAAGYVGTVTVPPDSAVETGANITYLAAF